MESREQIWNNLVKAVDENNDKETGFILAKILLDIREILANILVM